MCAPLKQIENAMKSATMVESLWLDSLYSDSGGIFALLAENGYCFWHGLNNVNRIASSVFEIPHFEI